ncbi:MAG TPA: DUF885 family protein, partial [Steroidobacteraceae bacterium]
MPIRQSIAHLIRASASGALLGALVLLSACDREPAPTQSETRTGSAEAWTQFVDRFIEDYFKAQPAAAVMSGRHEFDGQLPDWSADGIRAEIARLEKLRAEVLEFGDEQLPTADLRFQRDYVLSRIDHDLFWLRDARQPFTNPSFYFNVGLDPSTYVSVPYAPPEQRLKAFVSYALALPTAAQQIRANLGGSPLPRTFIDFGVAGFGGLAEFFRTDVPQAFAEVQD